MVIHKAKTNTVPPQYLCRNRWQKNSTCESFKPECFEGVTKNITIQQKKVFFYNLTVRIWFWTTKVWGEGSPSLSCSTTKKTIFLKFVFPNGVWIAKWLPLPGFKGWASVRVLSQPPGMVVYVHFNPSGCSGFQYSFLQFSLLFEAFIVIQCWIWIR